MMPQRSRACYRLNRRAFLGRHAGAMGTLALAQLLDQDDRRRGVRAAAADIERPRASQRGSPERGRSR